MGRNAHRHRPFERVDAHLAAEDGLVEADIEIATDGVAFDAEARMRDELDGDQRIAGLTTEGIDAALPFQSDDLARPRARWDRDLDRAPGRQVDARLLATGELLEGDRGGGGNVLAARCLRPPGAGTGCST